MRGLKRNFRDLTRKTKSTRFLREREISKKRGKEKENHECVSPPRGEKEKREREKENDALWLSAPSWRPRRTTTTPLSSSRLPFFILCRVVFSAFFSALTQWFRVFLKP